MSNIILKLNKRMVSSHIITFYIVLPFVIFFPALLFSVSNGGGWNAHWFIDIYITSEMLLYNLAINLLFGFCIYNIFKKLKVDFHRGKGLKGVLYSVAFSVFLLCYIHFPISYFRLFFFVLMFFSLKYSALNVSLILLGLIGLFELFFFSYRWPIILFMVIITCFYNYKIFKSFSITILGIILSVVVLNPLKHGDFNLQISVVDVVDVVFTHLNPIYMSSQFFYNLSLESYEVIAEAIPLAKLFTGSVGLIQLAENYVDLPNGSDFGSSSTSVKSLSGIIFVIFFLAILKFLSKIYILNSILFFYFIIMGPLFFRRSILNLINDVIVISAITIFLYLLLSIIKKRSKKFIL